MISRSGLASFILKRISAFIIGVSLLFWLPVEDKNVLTVILFSAVICTWWAVRWLHRIPLTETGFLRRHTLIGALAGLAISPVAILLMAIKTGLHGHRSPDFSWEQVLAVLLGSPFWALTGFLLGIGSGMWRTSLGNKDANGG